jgi:hypothetical protein
MDLLHQWGEWRAESPPYILDADRALLTSQRSTRATVVRRSWPEAFNANDFCAPGDIRLHLGLLPQPFFGDLRRASIFLLLLNPGLGPDDYFGEHEIPSFRAALLGNLKQEFSDAPFPFLFLDPQYSWHGGFTWWHSKLTRVIERLAQELGISFAAARRRLGATLASIELFPYHSASFHDAGGWLRNLPSVELARAFVNNVVIPRVKSKKAIVIVTRKAQAWNLPHYEGVVVYTAGEARAAHLTPDSPGGRAILNHLLSRGESSSISAA